MNPSISFWCNKKVLITGNTGFKGGWLVYWLQKMGANVCGYALYPHTSPNLFSLINSNMDTEYGDIRNHHSLDLLFEDVKPDIVFHLAAQALVSESFKHPVATYETNIIGTVNVLEAVRKIESVRAIIIVTSDKCYDNLISNEFVETDKLGGNNPYSSSKACAELIVAAYRKSFPLPPIATARAGNIIGGGDWSSDRLIPDCIRAIVNHQTIPVRNPMFIRPWQHVLDPLNGYLILAERLYTNTDEFAQAWNFGPDDTEDFWCVRDVVEMVLSLWGCENNWSQSTSYFVEDRELLIDSTKAATKLGLVNKLNIADSIVWTVDWYKKYYSGISPVKLVDQQIERYIQL